MDIKTYVNFFEDLIEMDDDIDTKNCEIKEMKKRRSEMVSQFIKDAKALDDTCDLTQKDIKFAYQYYCEASKSDNPEDVYNTQWDLVAQLGQYLQKENG